MVYFSNLSYTKIEADNKFAKLGDANTFSGQNTFNQRITSYKGFQTSNGDADILSMNSSNEKKANVVYKQTGAGFKNWCHMQYLWTNDDSHYTNLLTFTFKPDSSTNNNIVEFTTALGGFTFNKKVNFQDNIELKNPTNNNGALLTNFQYQSQNLTSLKFNKNSSQALLVIEVNNDTETAKIECPTNNNLEIKHLKNPTDANDAANKYYVDNIVKYVEKRGGLSFTKQEISTVAGATVNKYYATVNFSDITVPNGKHIISCYFKNIPSPGQHLVLSFFPGHIANQCLIEIYQYNSASNITTDLNNATYSFTYLNA